MNLRAGDWVEIKTKEEILRTLDKKGRFQGMPFMPQMFQYCGQRFKVYKRAHKTCDTVDPIRGLRVRDAVHLDLRCDGAAYGGCQAACLLFWKTAWLRPITELANPREAVIKPDDSFGAGYANTDSCTESDVWAATHTEGIGNNALTYICQATQLPHFTTYLPWWDISQYVEDYTSGNVTLGQLLRGFFYATYVSVAQAGIGVGPVLRWLYDVFQSIWHGVPYPRKSGSIPIGQSTPASTLNLQPGELVRVKSYAEILATLNTENKNHGLYFDAEAVPYCGGTFRVRTRLNRYIEEKSGRLIELKNESIILESVTCQSRYSGCRMLCPRSIYSWWREVWLERVTDKTGSA